MNKAAFCLFVLLCYQSFSQDLKEAASRIRIVQSADVNGCKFLGNVKGHSGFNNVFAAIGIRKSRERCLEQAAKLGATHIVFTNSNGFMYTTVEGQAYYCDTLPLKKASKADSASQDTSKSTLFIADELKKLADLKEKGLLTKDEYNIQKSKLIGK